eukprot:3564403-Prymnesium_polylepis.1
MHYMYYGGYWSGVRAMNRRQAGKLADAGSAGNGRHRPPGNGRHRPPGLARDTHTHRRASP